jgi:diguanylate cyclase (GGDEF)-like protein/PAS domain S-box-containing protein
MGFHRLNNLGKNQDKTSPEDLDVSRLEMILAICPAVIYTLKPDGDKGATYVSENIRDQLGYEPSECIENPDFWASRVHPEDRTQAFENQAKLFQAGRLVHEYRFKHKDGTYRWMHDELRLLRDSTEKPIEIVGSWMDITDRKLADLELLVQKGHLKRLSEQDFLTGLPNRRVFQDRLKQAIARADRSGKQVALLFLDLDLFKKVNDTLGHQAGDLLLGGVAKRLQTQLREMDAIARLGGDEFVFVVEDISGTEQVTHIAQRILDCLEQPYPIRGQDCYVSASIGISLYTTPTDDIEELQKRADIAMYAAKKKGRNNFQFYNKEMDARAQELLLLGNDLRRALEKEQLVLHYQPKVNLSSGQIVGLEALVRWQHPDKGMVPPSDFIPLAEDTGLIVPIGKWILRTACDFAQTLQDAGIPPLRVSVNISMHQFKELNFLESVFQVLNETGLNPQWLELEITESIAMENARETIPRLASLNKMGVWLAIDDFGKGHSSLSRLKHLPITTLKIDKGFVGDILTDQYDFAIVEAVLALSKSLDLEVVAEGIETQEQKQLLCQLGCSFGQGFLFSRPLPPDDLLSLCRLEKPFADLF